MCWMEREFKVNLGEVAEAGLFVAEGELCKMWGQRKNEINPRRLPGQKASFPSNICRINDLVVKFKCCCLVLVMIKDGRKG